MDLVKKVSKALIENPTLILVGILKHIPWIVSDKFYIKIQYKAYVGKFPNLKDPKSFTEKIQWLKLYDRNPLYTKLVDKVTVKDYVKNIIGEEFIIPTLFVWDNPEDIDYMKLPEQFVLKCNHTGGGSVFICKNKKQFDFKSVVKSLNKQLKSDTFLQTREWPYKNIERKVFCEQFMEDVDSDLIDYKFFCFGGKVNYCQVIKDRYNGETIDFFDRDWNHQEFIGLSIKNRKHSKEVINKPQKYKEMIQIAERLSANIKFVRVGLYNIKGKIYFGELTLYPASGNGIFTPSEWDLKIGNLLHL